MGRQVTLSPAGNLVTFWTGDCRQVLAQLRRSSVDCIVTSPPYWGLRDYEVPEQIGIEAELQAYIAELVLVFREARRVLADDGTLWLNIGDAYAAGGNGGGGTFTQMRGERAWGKRRQKKGFRGPPPGLKHKDLIGLPWLLAFALRADGWFLRSEIVWAKPNPMPESTADRPHCSHEKIFLLSKSRRYFYDADSVREPVAASTVARLSQKTLAQQQGSTRANGGAKTNGSMKAVGNKDSRHLRNVWSLATSNWSGAHFATFPVSLAKRCITAGTRPGGVVLDPFGGSGTTALAADELNRHSVLIELNPKYVAMARERLQVFE